jgi:hypothetical protein
MCIIWRSPAWLNNYLSRIIGWIYVGPFVCKSITIVCFVLFFLLYSHIVKAKYSRLLYWHALYLGQAETQYLSLIRSFHEHIVAFHLIKTYALIIERSHKNVIGLIFGQGALDGQIYTLNVSRAAHLLTGSAVHQRSISDRTILIAYNVSHFLCECSSIHQWIYSNLWLMSIDEYAFFTLTACPYILAL